ncbi:TetR family transcriptional regulator C-terminal domain-containing protein [Streptomyces sp. NPDC057611]|uniref:TetR family transcriptional regulator C-terminal domain-containing protein n=1 Tax=Streptomyces sp. NPDC057611 TaxID=3346182 RepID=UPI0036AAC705
MTDREVLEVGHALRPSPLQFGPTEDTDRQWRMWFDYWNAGEQGADETFARGQAQRYEAWHHQFRHLIERGVAEGAFTCDDLDGVTVLFAALADGLALQHLRQTPPLTTEDARRHLNHLIETELARKPPAPGASCV